MNDTRPKTIICDIDGTLVDHRRPSQVSRPTHEMNILTGTLDKLEEWDRLGYRIILLTGRKESMREETEIQLKNCGIFYDQLIMGVGGGDRVLINDKKENGRETAFSINLDRNQGIRDIKI